MLIPLSKRFGFGSVLGYLVAGILIEADQAQVLIAGFSRFGQIFGRIPRAQGIPFTAVDHDPDQIQLLRKFGNKVYYGDCSREQYKNRLDEQTLMSASKLAVEQLEKVMKENVTQSYISFSQVEKSQGANGI